MDDKTKRLLAQTKRENDTKEQLENVIETLSRITNNMGCDFEKNAKILSEKFSCTHRTLQQDIIRLLAQFIKYNANAELPTDLRNEDAIEWCKKVSEIDHYFSRI